MAISAATSARPRGRRWSAGGAASRSPSRVGRSSGKVASPTASCKRSLISLSFIGADLRAQSQPLERAIGSRLGGLGGNAERLGDLLEREVEVVAEDHDQPLVVGQLVQG